VESETFLLISKRAERMKRKQVVQHVFGAICLIVAGYGHLAHATHVALPVAEILTGVALMVLVLLQRFRHNFLPHGGIAWVELAGATMMLVEAIGRLQERHHRSFYIVQFLPPLVLLMLAVFDARVTSMRKLTSDPDRFKMRLRLWFWRSIAWQRIQSWTRTDDSIVVVLRGGGTKRFPFRGVVNKDEAIAWAEAQFARRVSAPQQLPAR
jgi:hypothetical protein